MSCCGKKQQPPPPPRRARIKTITFFYNEAALIPFYLNHYWWADQIHAVVSKSDDATRELLAADKRVFVEDYEFPGGKLNDGLKRDKMNSVIESTKPSDYDWTISCDADEFIWFGGNPEGDARDIMARIDRRDQILVARLWDVYRHRNDEDLDPARLPIVYQRRHGNMDRKIGNARHYQKPCVLRVGSGIRLDVGAHTLLENTGSVWSPFDCDGAHWQMADPAFCVKRMIQDRLQHLSPENRKAGWGFTYFDLDEKKILDACAAHLDDPKLF